MKKLILLAMVMALLLGGCATYTWRHPEYTPEKWARERYECERDARQSGYYGTGIYGAMNMQAFFERCLESKGWVKTKNEPQAAYIPREERKPSIPPEERKPSPVDGVQTYYMSLAPDQKNKLIEEYMVAKKSNNNLLWPEFLKSKMEGSSYGSGQRYTPTIQHQPSREPNDIEWFRSLSPDQKRKLNDEYAIAKKENENLTWPEFLKGKREGRGNLGYHWEKDEKGNPVYVPHK